MTHSDLRRVLTIVWVAVTATALYVYFVHREALEDLLGGATGASAFAGAAVYLVLGCLRGFTLVPVTSLVLLGIVFFEPWPLFILTLAGIIASSASVYYFAEAMHMDEVLRRKHGGKFDKVRGLLERRGFPIIIAWAFFPIVPTDLICYLAGVVKLRIGTVLLAVAIGEGTICAIYIFLGDTLLRMLGLR